MVVSRSRTSSSTPSASPITVVRGFALPQPPYGPRQQRDAHEQQANAAESHTREEAHTTNDSVPSSRMTGPPPSQGGGGRASGCKHLPGHPLPVQALEDQRDCCESERHKRQHSESAWEVTPRERPP